MAKETDPSNGKGKETAWDKVERDPLAEAQSHPQGEILPIFQDWVMRLGLRLQGVLVSAIRGCDTVQRHDHSKVLARIYRAEVLRSHAGDPAKSKSFIMWADIPTTVGHMQKFLNDCDHLPQHYVMQVAARFVVAESVLSPAEKRSLEDIATKLSVQAHKLTFEMNGFNKLVDEVLTVVDRKSPKPEPKALTDFAWRVRQLKNNAMSKEMFDPWALVHAAHALAREL